MSAHTGRARGDLEEGAGDAAIRLFQRRRVVRAQPRFDVRDRDREAAGREAEERDGVRVAEQHDRVGLAFGEHVDRALQDRTDAVGGASCAESREERVSEANCVLAWARYALRACDWARMAAGPPIEPR